MSESTTPRPEAWRIFDGEGGYDYRTYEGNESYQEGWRQRNPQHPGWVEPLYAAPSADAQDAARYRFLKADFSPMGMNIDGQHSWAYRRNATLKGPTLDAAIDAAILDLGEV